MKHFLIDLLIGLGILAAISFGLLLQGYLIYGI